MIKHAERIRKVGATELEMGEGYHNVTVEVTTAGGVAKTLTFSESEAATLAAALSDALGMRPAETRGVTFRASIRAGGKPATIK